MLLKINENLLVTFTLSPSFALVSIVSLDTIRMVTFPLVRAVYSLVVEASSTECGKAFCNSREKVGS